VAYNIRAIGLKGIQGKSPDHPSKVQTEDLFIPPLEKLEASAASLVREIVGGKQYQEWTITLLVSGSHLMLSSWDASGSITTTPLNWTQDLTSFILVILALASDTSKRGSDFDSSGLEWMDDEDVQWKFVKEERQDFANCVPREDLTGGSLRVDCTQKDAIFVHGDLFGRWTRVYNVHLFLVSPDGSSRRLWANEELVLKMAWQDASLPPEFDTILAARNADPEHTPAVLAYTSFEGDRLPAAIFRAGEEEDDEWKKRRMDVMISRKYEKADRLEGQEYLKVFRDIVECEQRSPLFFWLFANGYFRSPKNLCERTHSSS
jgi:hypothetical protein